MPDPDSSTPTTRGTTREAAGRAPVRWVAFDAVGTLIHPEPPARTVYFQAGRRHGSRLTEAEIGGRFRAVFAEVEECWPAELRTSEAEEERRWREIVARVLHDVPETEGCFTELFEWFASPHAWREFPDAAPALRRLTENGFSVAVASNFDRRLHPVLAGLPQVHSIPLRIVSSEVGHRKPAAEFYAALLSRTGAVADELVMVGDSHVNDVEGAEQAGLRAIWLNRGGVEDPAGRRSGVRTLIEAADRVLDWSGTWSV